MDSDYYENLIEKTPYKDLPFIGKIAKGMKFVEKTVKRLALAIPISYFLFYACTDDIIFSRVNKKEKFNKSQLEELLNVEKKQLGCSEDIEIVINDRNGAAAIKENGKYRIEIGENYRTRDILRHELYHIHDGHVKEGGVSPLDYIFWLEPQARIFQLTGIKL